MCRPYPRSERGHSGRTVLTPLWGWGRGSGHLPVTRTARLTPWATFCRPSGAGRYRCTPGGTIDEGEPPPAPGSFRFEVTTNNGLPMPTTATINFSLSGSATPGAKIKITVKF